MRKLSSNEIRKLWFEFFEKKGHKVIESAPLIPIDDDSLLWINAGVTPLKKYFDGTIVPENKRLVGIQKCIRTNDIENVGVTKRHHTFFEMMGNFSIGDYFKNEAIEFAFELLTSRDYFAIPLEKLYVTVYQDDEESYSKWLSVGIPVDHIAELEDNFWEIGEGPCGPDSEIFYDRGEAFDPNHDALEKFFEGKDNERYVEIWNNVFSQYNAKANQKRNEYTELPSKNIDTGAGFERWVTIFQNVDSSFETDLFLPIIKTIEEVSGVLYSGDIAFKVIADHIRALVFALADGATFENVGRGYILRRLLRRSVRYGKKLGILEPFMYKLVDVTCNIMEEAYPYLIEKKTSIKTIILEEENLFHKTLAQGERKLIELMDSTINKEISGYDVFKLYDTYGFPYELTLEYLSEKGFTTNKEEFDKYMDEQRKISKQNRRQESFMSNQNEELLKFQTPSEFLYDTYRLKAKVIALFQNDKSIDKLTGEGYLILDKTCFYAESGGQVNDTGMIIGPKFKARVIDVTKAPNGQHLHKVKLLDGSIENNNECDLSIDASRRSKIEKNHSSVHLLQHALRKIISSTIAQDGSRVDENTLRFDFTYNGKIIDEELIKVEDYVNQMIENNLENKTTVMDLETAKKEGAIALFTEKYGHLVRVVEFGEAKELCGGTHVKNTGLIKKFAILSLENKGSNVYRIEAATDDNIEENIFLAIKPYNDEMIKQLMRAKNIVSKAKQEKINLSFDVTIDNSKPLSYKDVIFNKNELSYIQKEVKDLESTYFDERNKKALANLTQFENKLETVKEVKTIVTSVNNYENDIVKEIIDNLSNKYENSFIFVANVLSDSSISFFGRSNSKINAGFIIKTVSNYANGNGGGSEKFATGGSKVATNVEEILNLVKSEIAKY